MPCLQNQHAAHSPRAELLVRPPRREIEARQPAVRDLHSPAPQKFVGAIPYSGKTQPHAVFRKDIKIEIKNRLVPFRQHKGAAHLVFLVSMEAEPDIPNELAFSEGAQADGVLLEPQ